MLGMTKKYIQYCKKIDQCSQNNLQICTNGEAAHATCACLRGTGYQNNAVIKIVVRHVCDRAEKRLRTSLIRAGKPGNI